MSVVAFFVLYYFNVGAVTTEEASIGFRVGGGEDLAWEDEVVDDGLHGFTKLMAGQLVDSTRHRFLAGAIEIKNETELR